VGAGAEEIGATNVYYSTDYVFDGKKLNPYLENDLPNPLNVYSMSNWRGISDSQLLFEEYSDPYLGIYGKVPSIMKEITLCR